MRHDSAGEMESSCLLDPANCSDKNVKYSYMVHSPDLKRGICCCRMSSAAVKWKNLSIQALLSHANHVDAIDVYGVPCHAPFCERTVTGSWSKNPSEQSQN
ncbi:Os06g0202600 [Oryza sativa Japonica Group]|uniref:Os06g0202600 protein n=3 Tax=Oryza TaxID=4527 RepID=B7E9J3_ORYSJ|nr:unknown protein [Oryza sativa Japonica Group]BAF18993.1 Os06g0202600 [Oryza sativa Japonica Group]BAG89040.1 unnamed protein product [Oryza sativa Japonica Group]|eukprot:NP_001057079.1 Os06g0202600 [Oryza sativa Japonica Group]